MSHRDFLASLAELIAAVPSTEDVGTIHHATLSTYRRRLSSTIDRLIKYHRDLDPVRLPPQVFHPGRPEIVARMITLALEELEREPLANVAAFYGSGVYCLYYHGDHPAYALISNTTIPIYAGMASPKNTRAENTYDQGKALFTRLNDHRDSILEAQGHEERTLEVGDFSCRYLVVESGWEAAAESHMIRQFRPIWNKETRVCQGLGKHGDSHTTRGNTRSAWDTLHPGRSWATIEGNKPNPKSREQIIADIHAHCLAAYPHDQLNQVQLSVIAPESAK